MSFSCNLMSNKDVELHIDLLHKRRKRQKRLIFDSDLCPVDLLSMSHGNNEDKKFSPIYEHEYPVITNP